MSFWDGTRWIDEIAVRRTPRVRLLERVAALGIGAMTVVAVLLPLVPFDSTRAAGPVLTVSPASAPAGTKISVVGSQFPARTKVQLEWDGSTAGMPGAAVNANGRFSAGVTVPNTATGTHTLGAVSVVSQKGAKATLVATLLASASFTVGALASPTPTLSATATPPPTAAPTPAPTPTPTATPKPMPTATPSPAPTQTPTAIPSATLSATPTPAPTSTPTTSTSAKLLFGLGTQAETAKASAITKQSPIHMLSSWYNSPSDLSWMTDSWHRSIYQGAYSAGYALHLITWTDVPETIFAASTGTVCGRAYPLSAGWADDMRQLAQAFAGSSSGPPLYVTLFTEFQTYPCIDNAWNPSAAVNNYYRALIAQYEKGVAIFHQYAPNARVSLGWGGWQTRWDDPSIGGGRSMIPYLATAMRAGDFVSFQAMAGDSNVTDIRAMTATLGAYGPVMLAHHMPDADTNSTSTVYSTFTDDVQTLLTPTSVASLVSNGLFAWSFMNDAPMQASTTTFTLVKNAVATFGR